MGGSVDAAPDIAVPPDDESAGSLARHPRDPWLDNTKWILVTFVVLGHGWAALPGHPVRDWLYAFVYLWHIPAFVLVTGYLSRSFSFTRRKLLRLVSSVVVPYLLFEGALAGFRAYVGGADLHRLWLEPHWLMWYLAALFLWRICTPLLRRVPHPLALSVAVSLVAGLVSGQVLDVQRTMSLLPFFVLGLTAKPEWLELLRRPLVRAGALASLLTGLALTGLVRDRIGVDWLYWDNSYDDLHASVAHGGLTRLALLQLSGVLATSVLALVPHRRTVATRLGSASLVVYLFHGFLVKSAVYAGLSGWAYMHPRRALVTVTVAAVAVSALLACPAVAERLSWLADPISTWLRRRPAPERAQQAVVSTAGR